MKIVTVIPIARGVFREQLSYFSAQDLEPGDLIGVTVRKKLISALVIETEPLDQAKSHVRQANFGLKKAGALKAKQFLSPELVSAAQRLADYHAAPLGLILKNILPPIMLAGNKQKASENINSATRAPDLQAEKLVIQDTDEERLSFYRNLVREALAKKQSILICEPTMADLLAIKPALEKGIEHYTVALYNQLDKKTLATNWQRALSDAKPLVIIATPSFLSLPRNDLQTVIIDRENASTYRTLTRPFLDYRRLAEYLTTETKRRLVLGDIVLRPETMYLVEKNLFGSIRAPKQRLENTGKTHLVKPETSEIWSQEVKNFLEQQANSTERLLLLTNRRGLAPLIICDDCGQSVTCNNCASPLVLHEMEVKKGIKETSIFRCHHCGETRTSEEKCKNCQSWRLRALGTGIDRVAKELKTILPNRPIFHFDSDHIKTYRAGASLIKKFLETPGGVLLGTEMVISYLTERVPQAVVVTIDSMLAIPEFRLNQKVFSLLSRLRALTQKDFWIQTRQDDNEVLSLASHGQLLEFYRQEIREREKFDYPPFQVFIKITHVAPESEARQKMKHLAKILEKEGPVVYPSLHQPGRGLLELNLLLKLAPADWPREDLGAWLKSLPPNYVVTVDPETLI